MNINPSLRGQLTVVARGEVSSPVVSADGDVVVYNQYKDGETAVHRHENGETVQLTTDGHASMHADVNADGSKIVYTRFSDTNVNDPGSWDVYLWDEESGRSEAVSAGYGNEMSPQISDDGRIIIWDDDVDRKLGQNDILKSVDGKIEHVTHGRALDLSPDISGNGERIVWQRYKAGVSEFWLQDQNGTVKPYLKSKDSLIGASQTYDGKDIVFADQSGTEEDLIRYSDRTGQRTVVAGVKDVKETWASISGDGTTVAWTGLDFRKGAPADTNVYMRRDGEPLQVTWAEGGMHHDPKLSADGKTLVWTWMDNDDINKRIIYKLDLDEAQTPGLEMATTPQHSYPRRHRPIPTGRTQFGDDWQTQTVTKRDHNSIEIDRYSYENDVEVTHTSRGMEIDRNSYENDVDFKVSRREIEVDRNSYENDVTFSRDSSKLEIDRDSYEHDIEVRFSSHKIEIDRDGYENDVEFKRRGDNVEVSRGFDVIEKFPVSMMPGGAWPEQANFSDVANYIGMPEHTADALDRWFESGADMDDIVRIESSGKTHFYDQDFR